MGIGDKVTNAVKKRNLFLNPTEEAFIRLPLISLVLVTGVVTKLSALNLRDSNVLIIRRLGYTIKKGDKFIDEHDTTYFVEEIDPHFIYEFGGEAKLSLEVFKVTYRRQPLELPKNTMQQIATINNTITITASGDVSNVTANANASQGLTSSEILSILENVVETSYDIENLRKMIEEIKQLKAKRAEIKLSKLSHFLKKAGTVCFELVKAFVTTYAAELVVKVISG